MDSYEVVITPDAEADMIALRDYKRDQLKVLKKLNLDDGQT